MRYSLCLLLCFLGISCREIQPLTTFSTLSGYQLNGLVTSPNGVPIESVEVRIYYNPEVAQTTPIDTIPVVVTDSTLIVDVAVYTTQFDLVRQLFLGYRPKGLVPAYGWDGRDEKGLSMPSGKYLIRYAIDTVIVKYSTYVLQGRVTTVTDALGRFTVNNDHLPIGEVFDVYYFNGTYSLTLRILPAIDLDLRRQNLRGSYAEIQLTKDRITNGVFTIQ